MCTTALFWREKKTTTTTIELNALCCWNCCIHSCSKRFVPLKEIHINCDCPHIRISPKLELVVCCVMHADAATAAAAAAASFSAICVHSFYLPLLLPYKISGNHNYYVWGIELNAINVINMICSVQTATKKQPYYSCASYICHMWSRSSQPFKEFY